MRKLPIVFKLRTREYEAARHAAQRIVSAGFECGMVGGAVRDLLLGRPPHDFDLVTSARPEELAAIFPQHKLVGASFGVSLVESDGVQLEVAAARRERRYLDGRHPAEIAFTRDLAEDMMRRDFTVNALWYDPVTGVVYDAVGGLDDLARGILRTVGDPLERFSEDYLRMLRAVRFAVKLDFDVAPATWRAICTLAAKTRELAGERVYAELTAMFTSPFPARALRMLRDCGLLAQLLPEVNDLAGVEQPPRFHPEGDVFEHTALMLSHMAMPDPQLAWSVLLHDVGKKAAARRDPDGRMRFFDHESIGVTVAAPIFDRLRFSAADREAISAAVAGHMRFAAVCDMRTAKIRRILTSPTFRLELELHRLDCISCHCIMTGFVYLLDRLRAGEGRALPAPWVRGSDLIRLGLTPGHAFKRILDALYEAQLAGEIGGRSTALSQAADMVAEEKKKAGLTSRSQK
ncbi:MAG: CCA tRNA nucleotidyltransferase [Victivallaceae bacterium]|nr:CCA tRNA nucleotidyltransferase [Victivallaceae bacterium]